MENSQQAPLHSPICYTEGERTLMHLALKHLENKPNSGARANRHQNCLQLAAYSLQESWELACL